MRFREVISGKSLITSMTHLKSISVDEIAKRGIACDKCDKNVFVMFVIENTRVPNKKKKNCLYKQQVDKLLQLTAS